MCMNYTVHVAWMLSRKEMNNLYKTEYTELLKNVLLVEFSLV